MKPHQVAKRLNLIADGIDKSRNPSRSIAVQNLKSIQAALEEAPDLEPAESDPGILSPETEYSIQVDLSITADFEGSVDRQSLTKKFKDELVAAIKSSMSITARELNLTATGARVKPVKIDCVVNEPPEAELGE